MQDFCKDAYLR